MARGVNKVILIGTMGQDPEVKYAANGTAIVNVSLATSERWRDKNTNEQQEKTEWHRVVFFGKLAEIVGQYATKGGQLYVEGKLQTRKWTDQSGQDRYTTEVVVDFNGQMQLLGGGNRASGGQNNYQPQQAAGQQMQRQTPQQNTAPNNNASHNSFAQAPAVDDSFEDDEPPF